MTDLIESIKLPSNWTLVTPDSILKYLAAISKTGNVFNKEQLIKTGILGTTNEDAISRNLSYLKYLDVIDEERVKGQEQRFNVIDKKTVKDIFYELKAGRESNAKVKINHHLNQHILYQTIKQHFFAGQESRTLNDLEHFLRDGLPGKNPQYYQKGGEFLMRLLNLAELVKLDGNDIVLKELEEKQTEEPKVDQSNIKPEINQKSVSNNTQINEPKDASGYNVSIHTPDVNLNISVKTLAHVLLIESLLGSIKEEIIAASASNDKTDVQTN